MKTEEPKGRVLVVDDNRDLTESICDSLGEWYEVKPAFDAETGLEIASAFKPHAALLDTRLPKMSGLEMLVHLRRISPDTVPIMLTIEDRALTAIEAIRTGARHYIVKPFELDDLLLVIERSVDEGKRRWGTVLPGSEADIPGFCGMIGDSPPMIDLFARIKRAAGHDVNTLITGPTGSGKEVVARAIHRLGSRNHGPFVPANCSSFTNELAASLLFGHVKGAFTGATHSHIGLFEEACGGVLFLDEIENMPISGQARLLRVLEEKEVRQVGAGSTVKVDVRIVSAANCDLHRATRDGTFREDLFHRLRTIQIEVPSLRERRLDIPLLIAHFMKENGTDTLGTMKTFSSESMFILENHPWNGNVRELKQVIFNLCKLTDNLEIQPEDITKVILSSFSPRLPRGEDHYTLRDKIELEKALIDSGWNLSKAGELLGRHRNTIREQIKRMGIRRPNAN